MIQTRDLKDWLQELLPDEHFFPGPDLPKFPGRMVVLSPAPGAGLTMEYLFDTPSWQVRAVGPQARVPHHSAAQAEELIWAVDKAILTAVWPQSIAGHHVIRAQRFGSGPSPLSVDTAGRVHFVCTYLLEAESGYA